MADSMNLAHNTTVYLLEQDTDITETIRSLCDEKSMQLKCFQTPLELTQAVKDGQPSCIIAANDQPSGQALSLMQGLSNHVQEVPVIILGHHNDVSSAVAAIKAGALDYIEKPVIYGRLAEQLNQVVKHSIRSI